MPATGRSLRSAGRWRFGTSGPDPRDALQCAVTYRSNKNCWWNTGSPAPVRKCAQGGRWRRLLG